MYFLWGVLIAYQIVSLKEQGANLATTTSFYYFYYIINLEEQWTNFATTTSPTLSPPSLWNYKLINIYTFYAMQKKLQNQAADLGPVLALFGMAAILLWYFG